MHIVLFNIFQTSYLTYPLKIPETLKLQPHMLYRIFTGVWTYYTIGEFFFSTLILYLIGRQIERMWGSLKTVVFFFYVILIGIPIQLLFAIATPLWSGLYLYIFALLIQYWRDIPAIVQIQIFGKLKITEKWILYVLGFQMFFGNFWYSSIVSLIGMILGLLWGLPFMKRAHRLVPNRIVQFFRRHVYPRVNPYPVRSRNSTRRSSRPSSQNNTQPNAVNNLNQQEPNSNNSNINNREAENMAVLGDILARYSQNIRSQQNRESENVQRPNRTVVADQTLLDSLVEMGFQEDAAREALIASNNDINNAVTYLSYDSN